MKKSLMMISAAGVLGALLVGGTALGAAPAAWHISSERLGPPLNTTPLGNKYQWSWINGGPRKYVDFWVGVKVDKLVDHDANPNTPSVWVAYWNLETRSENLTTVTPHSAASRCAKPGFPEKMVYQGVSPTGNFWSGANGREWNKASCAVHGAGYKVTKGQAAIFL